MGINYKKLPFWDRPDLSPYLIHLTKRKGENSAFDNLIKILKSGWILGSTTESGFIRGTEVISPFLVTSMSRGYATCASFMAGVMPPMPMLGRSLL